MMKMININNRGTLTLPKNMRRQLGIKGSGQILAETKSEGILLRTGVAFPLEIYRDERLKEFTQNNEAALAPFSLKKKRK